MISPAERHYINSVITHLTQLAWMTSSDYKVAQVIIELVKRHDSLEEELNKLKAK